MIDGFIIDMEDYYEYASGPNSNFDPKALGRNGAVDLARGGILRNSMIVNSINAIRAAPGALIENNVIVNSIYAAVISHGGDNDTPVTIRNNTVAFVWATQAIAAGGTEGAGVDVTGKAVIESNLIVHSDNHGVSIKIPGKVSFTGNAFWRNLYSNVTFYQDGKKSSLDDTDINSDDDVGFAKAGGNVAMDPKLSYDPAWYDVFLRRTASIGTKFNEQAWEATRVVAGLSPSGEKLDGIFAPAYPPMAVPALVAPESASLKQGARINRSSSQLRDSLGADAREELFGCRLRRLHDKPQTVRRP